jgi:hypothetical protein
VGKHEGHGSLKDLDGYDINPKTNGYFSVGLLGYRQDCVKTGMVSMVSLNDGMAEAPKSYLSLSKRTLHRKFS